VPPVGETDGGHELPVAVAPEEGVPALPGFELDGVGLDGLELDDDPDEFSVDPADAPFPALGTVPHGDPLGEVPAFGDTVDG